MGGLFLRTRLLVVLSCLSAFCVILNSSALSQEMMTVRVGVAVMRAGTDKVSVTEARDRLVKDLNQQKPDKKLRLAFQAVALDASQPGAALAEARAKQCEFVLSTHLTDLLTAEKLISEASDYRVLTTAVVSYEVMRVVDGATYAAGSARVQDEASAADAIRAAMDEVTDHVVANLKKGGNAPPPAVGTQEAVPPAAPPPLQKVEVATIGSDFCKWLPGNIPHASALYGVCDYAMSLPRKMPNFVCDQQTSRFIGNGKVPHDMITASVRYEDGNESYSDIKLNGKSSPDATTSAGQWSTGEFGSDLRAIFDVGNNALFEFSRENSLLGRAVWVFTFNIVKQNDPMWRLRTEVSTAAPPYGGELWVDQKTGELLRFRSVARDFPKDFPIESAELQNDYDDVAFGDGSSFLLPVTASVAMKRTGELTRRNVLQFRNCHKFRARSRMLLSVAPGVAGAETEETVRATPAEVARQAEQNEQIYSILREQAVREDDARLAQEQSLDLSAATVAAYSKMMDIEKARQKILAEERASAERLAAAQPQPLTTIRVSVKLVQVGVVTRDSRGRTVGSLKKDDFRLFDNGRPQAISSFLTQKTEKRAEPEPQVIRPGATMVRPEGPSTGRDVAFVFDDMHITTEDLASAGQAASRHLQALRPQDRAAVFTTSGQVQVDFTSNAEKLQDALQKLRPHRVLEGPQCPPMTSYMADLIVNHSDLDVLGMATKDAVNCAFGGAASENDMARAERIAKTTAMQVLNASAMETQTTLNLLGEVVQRTAQMAGSRSIVVVSPGFLTRTGEAQEAASEIIDRALRADIVVNTLDVRGLVSPMASANESHPADPVQRATLDREEAQEVSDVMADLAYSTGGVFFHNNNDLDEGFRRTADVPEFVYVLGFSPQKLDGKFHKLKVTLASGEKLAVQARQGYYALKR